ncbi:hypothetical protein CDL15_Pgr023150 [Punica granatum]|uniref:Uncharacterized protein n=1 Tax=Punica granatum TaxID=22663 RepID=A0A218X4M3_PUNGR|nr:hypothetical protein CDL15_Pgr023150 [Punica granatum]
MNFVNSWADIARGLTPSFSLFHDRTLLKARVSPVPKYPYDDFVQIAVVSDMKSLYQKEKSIAKMFTFSANKLAAIKKMAMADQRLQACRIFSALTAPVWQAHCPISSPSSGFSSILGIYKDITEKNYR